MKYKQISKTLSILRNLSFLFLFAFIFLAKPVHAADYSITLSPTPGSTLGTSSYTFESGSHPQITISVSGPTERLYNIYDLYIMNGGSEFKKHGGDKTKVFNSPYTWDLCAGNQDFTNGNITIILRGTGLASLPSVTNDLATTSFVIASYKGGCAASSSEIVPNASDLAISGISGGQASVTVSVSASNLTAYTSGNQFHLLVDGVDKTADYKLSGGAMTFTWDASGSAAGAHTLNARFQSGSTGSLVTGADFIAYKNNDNTVTTTSKDGVTPPDSGGSGGSGSLSPISFSVPDLSTLKGKTGSEIIVWLAKTVIDLFIIIASLLAGIAFIVSGIQYGLSFGDAAKAEKAKKNLVWASIGVAIMISSITVITIVSRLVNYIQ
ncbi:MAG: hypothetical protein WC773_03440 [Patescibacteria group bacterium]|jgi:hypothetical protein